MRSKTLSDSIDLTMPIQETEAILEQFMDLTKGNGCLAFSGGKDSIVMSHLAQAKTGIQTAICETSFCFEKDLKEYHQIAVHLGLDCTFEANLSEEWLQDHQEYIFGAMRLQSKMYALRQQATIKNFVVKNNFDGVIFGRRTQENSVKSALYQTKNEVWQCHPLRNWTTDQVWAYIAQHELPYPSIYDHTIGQYEGATPWCCMNTEKLAKQGYTPLQLIYEYEPKLLKKVAMWYAPAKEFLSQIN